MCQDGHMCPEKRGAHNIFITHCEFKKRLPNPHACKDNSNAN